MEANAKQYNLSLMARLLDVSRSGYYEWLKSKDTICLRKTRQQQRDAQIKSIFVEFKSRYGARRIHEELAEVDDAPAIKTIRCSMKRQNLVAKAARKFKVTTDSNHDLRISPNLLGQNFTASAPNQKWAGDITYLRTSEGWMYLAVIIDLYSRAEE